MSISNKCRELYNSIKNHELYGKDSPSIPDSEWSGTDKDLSLLMRFLDRRARVGK